MFWDGHRWLDDSPLSSREGRGSRPQRRRFRDWVATLTILLLLPALLVPVLSVSASQPTLSVSGGGVPGGSLTVDGTGFGSEATVQLLWDGSASDMPSLRTSGHGAFTTTVTVPSGATAGAHELAATEAPGKGAKSGGSDATIVASVAVTVVDPSATPAPTLAPSLTAAQSPTPVPTPVPTATPTPTLAPTPLPSSSLTITDVGVPSITDTQATITWTLSAPATGQVEYGTTTAYGSFSKLENSFIYSTHIQQLYNLSPSTLYHFRVHSTDASGDSVVSGDYTFTTLATSASSSTPTPTPTPTSTSTPTPTPAPTSTSTPTSTATPTPTPTPAPTATPTSTTVSAVSGPYGSVQGDSRNNHQVGASANASLDYRFRASTSSAATALRVQQRGGTAYSGGDGGTIQATIQADASGVPSGTVLAALTWSPGNPSGNWEVWTSLTFPSPATLAAGQMYHLVFNNTAADPINNFISLNDLFYWGAQDPHQPTFSNDFATLYNESNGWKLQSTDTPIFDLTYANGRHDGMGYIGSMPSYYGSISGASNMVREHFTVSGSNRSVSSASVKVKRISGSSALTISLMQGGTVLASGSVAASAIALGNLPTADDAAHLGGNTWATVTFPTTYLMSGTTYDLVLSTPADTQYITVPVQEGTDKGLRSYRFTDGSGQRTTNGGSTWANLYLYSDVDLQFVIR